MPDLAEIIANSHVSVSPPYVMIRECALHPSEVEALVTKLRASAAVLEADDAHI